MAINRVGDLVRQQRMRRPKKSSSLCEATRLVPVPPRLGRVGGDYVMRDCDGTRVALPLSTEIDRLRAIWTAFRSRPAGDGDVPSTIPRAMPA